MMLKLIILTFSSTFSGAIQPLHSSSVSILSHIFISACHENVNKFEYIHISIEPVLRNRFDMPFLDPGIFWQEQSTDDAVNIGGWTAPISEDITIGLDLLNFPLHTPKILSSCDLSTNE
jgi:hypothetical protein